MKPVELLDALGPRPKLALAARAPELVKCEPLGPKFSVVPLRSPSDRRLRGPHFHLLVALGGYANVYGRLYPSQLRLAADCGRSQPWVSRYMRDLVQFGYLRPLAARSKRRTSRRYQLMWTEHEERPPWEKLAPLDLPWPLREKARAEFLGEINSKVSTSRKENRTMARPAVMTYEEGTAYRKRLAAGQITPFWKMSKAEVAEHQRFMAFEGAERATAYQIADSFGNGVSLRWRVGRPSEVSIDTALGWLRRGVEKKAALAHIDAELDRLQREGKCAPMTLAALRAATAPEREKTAA